MSWTHYSKVIALGVLLAVALGAAGTAVAADITITNEPEVGEEGDEVSMEIVIDDPHPPSQWALDGETELDDATWSIEMRDIDDNLIEERSVGGNSFSQNVDSDDRTDEITIQVSGEIPELDTFDYEDIDAEEYTVMRLTQDGSLIDGGEIRSHRWQANSEHQDARQALDSASAAVEDADDDDAREDLENAIAFYNQGDFDRAIDLAESAESQAEQAGQTRQLLMIGGAIVAVLVVLGGGFYYYRSRQQDTRKLQ